MENDPSLQVAIFEKGNAITKRQCPIVAKKVEKCVKCPSCSIMEGMAGAGAFSDGKYVISTEYGGWLTDFLKPETVILNRQIRSSFPLVLLRNAICLIMN